MLNSLLTNRIGSCAVAAAILFFVIACSSNESKTEQLVSVYEVMQSIITPATDTIWGVEDPQSDEEWQQIEFAANTVIVAATQIKQGGSGPNDAQWASEIGWQQYADMVINAAIEARKAALSEDLDAVFEAGNILYPPCEECHKLCHPGFQQ